MGQPIPHCRVETKEGFLGEEALVQGLAEGESRGRSSSNFLPPPSHSFLRPAQPSPWVHGPSVMSAPSSARLSYQGTGPALHAEQTNLRGTPRAGPELAPLPRRSWPPQTNSPGECQRVMAYRPQGHVLPSSLWQPSRAVLAQNQGNITVCMLVLISGSRVSQTPSFWNIGHGGVSVHPKAGFL